jgi:ribosomal protein L37AE/L43A
MSYCHMCNRKTQCYLDTDIWFCRECGEPNDGPKDYE